MILPGRPTGMAYLRPLSGRRAEAGARPARPLIPERSPLAPASSAPRSVGTLGSAACGSTTWSPSTTPSRRPVGDSKLTIFILVLFLRLSAGERGVPSPMAGCDLEHFPARPHKPPVRRVLRSASDGSPHGVKRNAGQDDPDCASTFALRASAYALRASADSSPP